MEKKLYPYGGYTSLNSYKKIQNNSLKIDIEGPYLIKLYKEPIVL